MQHALGSVRLTTLLACLVFGIAGCNSGDSPDDSTHTPDPAPATAAGNAQKGPFQPGGTAAAFPLQANGSRGAGSMAGDITSSGSYTLAGIDWTGPTQLEMTGTFFNEVTGNFSMGDNGEATLYGLTDLSDDVPVNVNLFTHFITARMQALMAKDITFADARDQARDELTAIIGVNAAPSALDLRHDDGDAAHEDDSANLLLFSAATLAGGVNQAGIDAIAADFADDGRINGGGQAAFDAIKQTAVDEPDLLATARANLQNQYSVTPPDDTDGQPPVWVPGTPAAPVAAFTTSGPLKAGEAQAFDAGDSTGDGLVYAWDFGDGATASGPQTTHAYSDADDYTVTLTITDDGNRTDTASRQLTITQGNTLPAPPEAAFVISGDRTEGSDLTFKADGSTGASLSYAWNFDDGNNATGAQTTHVFADAGDYAVALTVTDSAGQNDTATRTVTIVAAGPQAAFTVSGPATAGQAQSFNAKDSTGDDLTYYWSFGDGDAGRSARIPHVYDRAGDYTIKLTVTDGDNNSDSASQSLTVAEAPQPVADDGAIDGRVVDTDNSPIEGVQVRLVNAQDLVGADRGAATDADGKTTLGNMPTGVEFVLALSKDGYAERYVRTTIPAAASDAATFAATMTERAAALTLPNAENGGNVTGTDGTAIVLPANALVDRSGNPVSGDVEVALTPVDVSDVDARDAFPGSFAAADENGDSGLLLSFGVAEYNLTQNGERLQIAPGKQATLTVPVYIDTYSDGSAVKAGDSIPLWSLDETTGQWAQEGMGTVVADSNSPTGLGFEMIVGHLSWYNCDAFSAVYRPIPMCKIDGSSGLPTLDLSETCFITGGLVGDGPYSGVTTNILGDNDRALPVPAGLDYQLIATARNGTLRGSATFNGAAGASDNVDIMLNPIGGGGSNEAITLPYDDIGAIDPAGEVDRYTFTGQTDQSVLITAGPNGGSSLEGTIGLVGPGGQSLGSDIFLPGAPAGLSMRLPADGEYTLTVDGTASEPGGYHLVAETMARISIDQNLEGTIPIDGGKIRRICHGTAGTLISLENVGDSDVLLSVDDLQGNPVVTRRYSNYQYVYMGELPADADYILTIRDRVINDGLQDYRTAVARIEPPQPLTLDSAGRATVSGDIQVYGDRQFYKLTARGGDGLFVRLSQAASDALTSESARVRVYRPGSTPVYQTDAISRGDLDDYDDGDAPHLYSAGLRLPGDGTPESYLVEVSAIYNYIGAELGNYELRVDSAPAQINIVVDDDLAQCAGADSHSLRAAAYAVTDGGSIDVCSGVYSEYIPVTAPDGAFSVVGRSRSGVVLRSGAPNQEIVTGGYSGNAAQVQLSNLSIQTGGLGAYDRGAYVGDIAGATNITIEPEPGETHLPGYLSIETDNAIVDGLDYTTGDGTVTISADNVIVKNSTFTGSPGSIETSGKNLVFENNTLNIAESRGGGTLEFSLATQFGPRGGGVHFLNNDITVTSADPDTLGDDFEIQIGDDGSGDTGAIIRGNTLATDTGGFGLEGTGANAAFTMEQNRLTSTADAGGKLLQAVVSKKSALGSTTLLLRNNIFDGMAASGGSPSFDSNAGLTIVNPAAFEAVEIINNSFRARVNDEFTGANNGMLSFSSYHDSLPASYPVRLRNNIVQGIGSTSKQDAAIQIDDGVAIDADYDLFSGFDSIYNGGTSSAGSNDIAGDPLFIDNDLNVDPASPAVDAGAAPVSGGPPIPNLDYDGTSRPQNGGYDIGAHENPF